MTDKYWLFHKTHNPGVSAEDEDEESTEEGINAPTSTFTNAIDLMVEADEAEIDIELQDEPSGSYRCLQGSRI